MPHAHPMDEYETLRGELDAAYAEPAWDSARIDRIAARMVSIERTILARRFCAPAHEGEPGAP